MERDITNNRFNDGKCDPQGRFWAGTMDAVHWSAPAGNLYRFSAGQCLATMKTDVTCSNGSGWSPDRRTMYYTESFRYAIFAYDLMRSTEPLRTGGPLSPSIGAATAFPMG